MKYEKLDMNSSDKYKWLLCGLIMGVLLIIIINLIFSYAKYKSVDSVKLASGTINYESADLNVIAMYKNDGEGTEDVPMETIPVEGNYVIDNIKSYCIIGSDKENKIQNVFEYKDKKVYIAVEKKGTKCYVYFEKQKLSPAEQTLAALELKTSDVKGEPTSFTGTACGTSDCTDENRAAGLYKGTDDDGDTYYYRGNVTNNWVHFANMYWRIIRINGDGTIRLIYSGDTAQTTGTGTQINGSSGVAFNTNYDDNKYVGYMFDPKSGASTQSDYPPKTNSSSTKSTILTKIESWYNEKLKNGYSDKIDIDAGFCGDRSLAEKNHGGSYNITNTRGYGKNVTVYGPADRAFADGSTSYATSITPTFSCKNNADLYTMVGSSKGNKALPVPVGLITMDEVIFAGGYPGKTNNSGAAYYLYTNQDYWTMSPSTWDSGYARVFFVRSSGYLNNGSVGGTRGVRPVINLKANTKFSNVGGGDVTVGTMNKPYEVV